MSAAVSIAEDGAIVGDTAAPATAPSARLRRPPPPAPVAAAAARRDLRVTLVGELAEPAHACTEPATERAAISVTLAQGEGRPQVLATLWLGDGAEAMHYAHERAAALPRGALVIVTGDALRMRYHHGALTLIVGHVRRVERVADEVVRVGQGAAV